MHNGLSNKLISFSLCMAVFLFIYALSYVQEFPLVLGSEDNGDGRLEYLCLFSSCDYIK